VGVLAVLRERSLASWAWRVVVFGVLFFVVLELAGEAWGPVIAPYYHDPAYMSQTHTFAPLASIGVPEEVLRGIVFVLVLLPVLAVMRGRDARSLLALAGYVALLDAVVEGWLPMLAQTSWPLQFRLGEGVGDLGTDAIVRGVLVALLLALPALRAGQRTPADTPAAAT
jgi:hypothetical protein